MRRGPAGAPIRAKLQLLHYDPVDKGMGVQHSVYTVQKDRKIAIHGKVGLPRWRTSRRLWPGVYPTLIP